MKALLLSIGVCCALASGVERPFNADVEWRTARALLLEGDATPDREARRVLYRRSLETATRLEQRAPEHRMGPLGKALALGRLALDAPLLEARGLVNEIRANAERALLLAGDDAEAGSLAHYVLGRAHRETHRVTWLVRRVAGLAWASDEQALWHLEQAVRFDPRSPMIRVEYGRTLWANDREDEARVQWVEAGKLSARTPGEEVALSEAAALLKNGL